MSSDPVPFKTPKALAAWLARNHAREKELFVRCFKVKASSRGVTYQQTLDEALCFGWIDGVRRSVDDVSFNLRFTPRKSKSYWSAVNIRKAEALMAQGRMQPPGLAAFEARDQASKREYSFESKPAAFAPTYLKRIQANAKAHSFFLSRPPGYVRTHAFWVMSPVNEATRQRRLEILIACWERGEAIPPLARAKRTVTT